MRQSVSEEQAESFARREGEGWSSVIRQNSVKRIKGKRMAGKGVGESKGAYKVHVTVSTALAVFVECGVEVGAGQAELKEQMLKH